MAPGEEGVCHTLTSLQLQQEQRPDLTMRTWCPDLVSLAPGQAGATS